MTLPSGLKSQMGIGKGDNVLPTPSPSCEELEKIMDRYRVAIRLYSVSAGSLEQLTGPDFERAYQQAERARQVFEETRSELQQHMQQHGCR